jgi:cytochrome c553
VTQTTPTTNEAVVEAPKNVTEEVSKTAVEVTNTVTEAATKVVENTTEVKELANTAAIDKVKEIAVSVIEETKETTKESASNVIAEATAVVSPLAQVSEAKTEALITEVVAPIIDTSLNGELLFKSCASCHGQKAEKEALGKSQIIAGWNKEKIINALNGYKDGSYGGVMKNIMKGQVATKTDAEIDALATFISNL